MFGTLFFLTLFSPMSTQFIMVVTTTIVVIFQLFKHPTDTQNDNLTWEVYCHLCYILP